MIAHEVRSFHPGQVLTGIGDADFDAMAYVLALASCVLQALALTLAL